MSDSILDTVKKMLGLSDTYQQFDTDVTLHINTALSILAQLGVENAASVVVVDNSAEWSSLSLDAPALAMVQGYIAASARVAFDPPATSFHLEAMQNQIDVLGWRISVMMEGASSE